MGEAEMDQRSRFSIVEGVRWSESYAAGLKKAWSWIPSPLGSALGTLAIFLIGSTLRGEWIMIIIHFFKHLGYLQDNDANRLNETESAVGDNRGQDSFVDSLKLQNLSYFCTCAVLGSYAIYFILGGFLHLYFYVFQRDKAQEWKCQPQKWLSPELELHEILLGSLSLFFTSMLTGVFACHSYNGGTFLKLYHEWGQYGWLWLVLQVPLLFIYQDYSTYWVHRLYHTPWLYKNFHKLHHKYKQPTAFSVTAIHPVEIVHIQLVLAMPMFFIPLHWFLFYMLAIYTYYHGIIDHSGVTFKAHWWQPWQPDAIFHDNHHQYFHVNFGFNIYFWDKLHGTYRRKDRVYNEDIYYGVGKSLNDVSNEMLQKDIAERKSENPLAYKQNKNEFLLEKEDLKGIGKKHGKKN